MKKTRNCIYGNKFKGLRQVEDGDIAVLSVQDQNGNALQCQREQEGTDADISDIVAEFVK